MNSSLVFHEAKSKFAYSYDENTLHIRLRTEKNSVEITDLIFGDPFKWTPNPEHPDKWEWSEKDASTIKMHNDYSDDIYDYWFAEIKPEFKRTRYAFCLKNGSEEYIYTAHGFDNLKFHPEKKYNIRSFFNFPYINKEDVYRSPEWVKKTIWYQIFPERFANGDQTINLPGTLPWGSESVVKNSMRFGGDLQGVINHLDYIADLGITGIYFTPIFEAKSTHKYDTTDYFKIDSSFGTNDTFKELVNKAHKLGIRIMLDAVFNHCGFSHPWFQDVIKNGKNSEFFNCFHILREPVVNFKLENNLPGVTDAVSLHSLNYETFAFTPHMPKWNTADLKAEQYLIEIGKYWVKEYDIDGWRLDVSNEVSHNFWRKFRNEIKTIKPDCFIVGENWDNSLPWLQGDQFDSVMNYEFTYPVWQLLGSGSMIDRKISTSEFKDKVSRMIAECPRHTAQNMFNLLDCHDTSRIMTILSNNSNLVKIAYVILMSFTGSPSIYYGGEQGLKGENDGNRVCMIWENEKQNQDLYNHIKKLISLRKKFHSLRAVDIEWIFTDNSGVIIYNKVFNKKLNLHTDTDTDSDTDSDTITIILNINSSPIEIDTPAALKNKRYDIYNEKEVEFKEKLNLNAGSFMLIV